MGIILNKVTERYFAILEDYFGEALKVAAKYRFSTARARIYLKAGSAVQAWSIATTA
jgi:hypothetical protein